MNKMEPDRISSAPYARLRRRVQFTSPRVWLVLALVLIAGVGYFFVGNPFAGAPGGGRGGFNRGQMPPPPVQVATAELKDVAVVVRTIGTVLASATVQVKSQIDGQILAAPFEEGQMVKKGDLLFEIDSQPYAAALRQVQSTLARDQAQAQVARSEADRAANLAARGIVSTQQKEQTSGAADALAATTQADRAAVERAQLQLGYTKIRSPINGKTGAILVHPGNLVKANDSNALVTIQQVQPVKISFALPQSNVPVLQDRLNAGELEATLSLRSDASLAVAPPANSDITVKVDFIGNAIDPRTGTIELRATSDNPDLRLVPGELADVRLRMNTLKSAITVPPEAVNIGPNGNFVFVVGEDRRAEMRPVKIGYQDETVAAISDGLKAGERVVTQGQLRVIAGLPVSIAGEPGQGGGFGGGFQRGQGGNFQGKSAQGKAFQGKGGQGFQRGQGGGFGGGGQRGGFQRGQNDGNPNGSNQNGGGPRPGNN